MLHHVVTPIVMGVIFVLGILDADIGTTTSLIRSIVPGSKLQMS